jgi:hypothetical protein
MQACDQKVVGGSKAKTSKQHYLPEVGDEVAYVRSGHQAHLQEAAQPRRPWDCNARSRSVEMCIVESVIGFKPLTMSFTRHVEGASAETEAVTGSYKCNSFCCVKLRSISAPQDMQQDSTFYVSSLYLSLLCSTLLPCLSLSLNFVPKYTCVHVNI